MTSERKKFIGYMAIDTMVVLLAFVLASVLAGCTATRSVTTTYDAAGKIVSRTESQKSIIGEITASTQGKTVVIWESGWAAYISGSTGTQEDPTPHVKMFAGKTDKGGIFALPNQSGWKGIADTVKATKYELKVTPSEVSSADPAK